MLSKLNEIKKNMTMVALYLNEENVDAFAVGYICEVKEDKVLMLNVGLHGEYDGYAGFDFNDIFRIETDSKYLNKISKLKSFDEAEKIFTLQNDNVFDGLIKFAQDHNKICTIFYGDDGEIRGYVRNCGDTISILEIDDYGDNDGENIIDADIINKVIVDDVECRDIEKLSKNITHQ